MRKVIYLFGFFILFLLCFTNSMAYGQKVSQFERAGLCDLLIDKNGIYHAVFQESPDIGKPTFIYYAVSVTKGASWSKPVTISNDNTGNGAGYPRILQDGAGIIYAIWKRYGNKASQYPIGEVLLDGPGGYSEGTLFYKVLNGGGWSNAIQLNEVEEAQNSWFATVSPQGTVYVFWTQVSPESKKNNWLTWYYNDYLRTASLNGTNHSAFTDLNKPSPPEYDGGPPPKKGGINLHGYVDKDQLPHFIYEALTDNQQQIKYYDGKIARVIYSYPKYKEGNTFHNPPRLLVDEKGIDHLIFLPSSATLESEQIWDINLETNAINVLVQIQQKGIEIRGFQAYQGPKGEMAVTIEAGSMIDNTEAYGLFYQNGVWKNIGLTNNAAKEKFFNKEFPLVLTNKDLPSIKRYNSTFTTIAYDAMGKKSMLMTVLGYWSAGTVGKNNYSTSSPSILFSAIDK